MFDQMLAIVMSCAIVVMRHYSLDYRGMHSALGLENDSSLLHLQTHMLQGDRRTPYHLSMDGVKNMR